MLQESEQRLRESERQLRESNVHLRQLAESIPHLVWMGGNIYVTSTPGQGSCFSFTAFLEHAQEVKMDSSEMGDAQQEPLIKASILAVEDDPTNQALIEEFCHHFQLSGKIAGSAKEALIALKLERFDITLMGVQLPDTNGMELTKIIRNDLGLKIPIIATTAFAQSSQKEKFLNAGMDDYIAKPLDLDVLAQKIQKFMQDKTPDGGK